MPALVMVIIVKKILKRRLRIIQFYLYLLFDRDRFGLFDKTRKNLLSFEFSFIKTNKHMCINYLCLILHDYLVLVEAHF